MTTLEQEKADTYSPEKIHYYLTHWHDLQVAAEGGTGSLGGGGGGNGNRLGLADLLADLEAAADQLPLEWKATLSIFLKQGRGQQWRLRRLHLNHQPSVDEAVVRMARWLGWKAD